MASKGFKKGEPISGLMRTTAALNGRLHQHAIAIELDGLKHAAITAAKAWEKREVDRDRRLTELLAAAVKYSEAVEGK